MIIKSLEKMEKIVSENKNLMWDGWTVVSLKPIRDGLTSSSTIRIKGKWYLQKRFEPTAEGWNIPVKFME